MKLKTILLPTFFAALVAAFTPAALGQPGPVYYIDVNGATAGFGDPSGTISGNDASWTTDPTGSSATVPMPAWYTSNYNPVQLAFGYPGTVGISNDTFTVNANAQLVSDVTFIAPCTVTLSSFAVLNFLAPLTWSVPNGSTFNITASYGNWGFGGGTLTMQGGGTISFDCNDIGRNAGGGSFIQDMTNGTVNLTDAYVDSGVPQGSYELRNGTLNFATAASAGAIGGLAPAGSQYFKLSGGTLDNTSGSDMTLNLGYATCKIAGSFAFAGSSSLNFGASPVDLGTVTPTIMVSANTLEFDGVLSGTAGLTVAGAGTLMLDGANTYSGNTTVSAGTLALGSGGSIGSSPLISIANGATFDVSAAGWSGSGSQTLAPAATSGTGIVNTGVYGITLNTGDGLSFATAGGVNPSMGAISVTGNSGGALFLNNNTVTINVSGSKLGTTTNTLVTCAGYLGGAANPVPSIGGLGLADGTAARIITTSGSIVLVVTNSPIGSQVTTTTVALTTGTSSEVYGGQLTFTATVTGASTTPGGNVTFKDAGINVATVALTLGTSPQATATYTEYTTLKVAGSPHSITAYYQGDSVHAISDSSGSPLAQTITAKPLTYSGITAGSAPYNGTNAATLGGTPVLPAAEASGTGSTSDGTPYNVDVVTTGGAATGVLAANGVGAQPVTITGGVTLAGAGAGNYTVVQQTGLVQNVIPKVLPVTGLAIGSPAPALTGTASLETAENPAPGTGYDGRPYTADSVSLSGTPVGTLDPTSAPFNLVVDVGGLSLIGGGTGNYSLQEPVLHGSFQNGPAYYVNVNGGGPGGFGDPSGTVNGSDLSWTTDPTGVATPVALPPLYDPVTYAYNPVQLTFGYPGTAGISNDTFTVYSLQFIAGVVFNVPCTVTLSDFGLIDFEAPTVWSVPTNCTFNVAVGEQNWAFTTLTLQGDGTINFNTIDLGRNAGSLIQDMTGGTVNLGGAYTDGGTHQSNYELRNGTLNFANADSAGAFAGPSTGRSFQIDGGTTLDNTSGGSLTLNMGGATCLIAGSFAFAGSSSLNLGTGAWDLGTVTPTITVSNNTLEIDGVVAGTAGLTKTGAGTLQLTAANTYTGNTTVNAGTLAIAQATLATNSTITVANGAVLELDFAVTNTVTSLVLNGIAKPAGVYGSSSGTPGFTGTGSLLVLGSATPSPTHITYSVSGNALTLNWPAGQGWNLQSNSVSIANSNAWQRVTGATPPYPITINPSRPAVFYRLTYP